MTNMLRTCCLVMAMAFSFFCTAQQGRQVMPYNGAPARVDNTDRCGVSVSLELLRKDPSFKAKEDQVNRQIMGFQRNLVPDSTFIPVVFHIVNTNPGAVPNQLLINALNDLNDAFAKRGAYAASNGVDTKIRFCLAQKDPDGGITTGITRTDSYFSNHLNPMIEDGRLKDLIQWDPSRYVNIWYVASMNMEGFADFTCGGWARTQVAGYATMPPGSGPQDGIVVTSFGEMLVHEMGHYLGLYHTFEGRNCVNNNCATDGDKVCDTPPDSRMANSVACNMPDNSCNTDTLSNYSNGNFTTDVPDQISNFMDYGNSGCHNQFTQGQADRMLAAINTQRSGLLQNECDKPCTDNILASFTRSKAHPIPGDLVSFTNTSTGAANFEWLVDDVVVATGNNFTYTFATNGKYKVSLKAFNTATCFGMYTDYVTVNCGVVARFYTDKRVIASKIPIAPDSIYFSNTSENATAYQWLVANDKGMAEQVVSTAANLVYTFATPANYTIRLIATNGSCRDTTNIFTVPVADPTPDGVAYMTTVNCYQQTKVRVTLFACNNGYKTIPPGTPISFYDADPKLPTANKLGITFIVPDSIPGFCCGYVYTHIIDVQKPGLNTLYMVFNDSGNTRPLSLPNTGLVELNYANNTALSVNFRFKASVVPPLSTLEPGDTIQLVAQAGPGAIASYNWSPAQLLSCTSCSNPFLIADSDRVKRMIATSQFGCVDTAYAVIKVPPADDFIIDLNQVECAGSDSLFVNFTITNLFKRGTINKGLMVTFYDADPLLASANRLAPSFSVPAFVNGKQATYSSFIKAMGTGKLYAVVNDSGLVRPVSLPNGPWPEKVYSNNINSFNYTRLKVTASPLQSVLEPGDTLQLSANAVPGVVASYTWSRANNLSCTVCQQTNLVADSNRVKTVTAMNMYGCTDTASVVISVPPANDYTIIINDVQCASGDRLYVNFTLYNSFKRGVIPKGITVSFYDGDPVAPGSKLLSPVYSVVDTAFAKQFTYSGFIKATGPGKIYAVVNDSGKTVPVQLPNNLHLPEKDYTNNVSVFNYVPETVRLQPQDTTVLRKSAFPLTILTTIYNPASTTWFPGNGYTLSCSQCASPVVTVLDSVLVNMQTENKYGCLIGGTAVLNVFPPDFTIRITDTKCYTNNTTLVSFGICMGNNYDSVYAQLPVSFYDGPPAAGKLLSPVFYTSRLQAGTCFQYQHIVATPASGQLYAMVNDKGGSGVTVPVKQFNETDYTNNGSDTAITRFNIAIQPADTSISRWGTVQLGTVVSGGVLSAWRWQQDPFLSCTNCLSPVVTPSFTKDYMLIAKNEYACLDTAIATVRVFTGGLINLPSAFSPNRDGLNDIFYVLAGQGVALVKDFAIFNRWGQRVFEANNFPANDPRFGWDGTFKGVEAPPGAYVYQLRLAVANGKDQVFKGTIMLVR